MTIATRQSPQIVLRLPQDLKDWLRHRAIDNKRSLNSEVLHRLEAAVAREQPGAAA